MKIGLISDIHGNFRALEIVLNKLKNLSLSKIYFLGDAIGYIPFPNQVLSLLIKNNIICIKGNHEKMLLNEISYDSSKESIYRIQETHKKITTQNLKYIQSWPKQINLDQLGFKYWCIHEAPPPFPRGYIYPDTDLSSMEKFNEDGIVMGHTHLPMIREFKKKIFLNPGSVGLPRDHGSYASFMVLDMLENKASIYRTFIDNSYLCKVPLSEEIYHLFNRNKKFIGKII